VVKDPTAVLEEVPADAGRNLVEVSSAAREKLIAREEGCCSHG
jgi:hypothetical protein